MIRKKSINERGNLEVDDAIDEAWFYVAQQTMQTGTFHVTARESAIVTARRQAGPIVAFLADDRDLSRFSLGVKRVEFQIQSRFHKSRRQANFHADRIAGSVAATGGCACRR